MSQKQSYSPSENVDFVLSLEGEKLVPGSLCLEGHCIPRHNAAAITDAEAIYYDHHAGFHSLFRDITTEFQNLGIAEKLDNYPRLVHMSALASIYEDSLGSESQNACEGRLPAMRASNGMLQGNTNGKEVPFSLKLQIAANKSSGPLSAESTGSIRIRLRLASAGEFFYGATVDGTTTYTLDGDLKLRYQTIPDDGSKQPVKLEVYHAYKTNIDSNNANVSTFVPGLCDAFHISFKKQQDESDVTKNYLGCEPLPGEPPYGADPSETSASYGIERLYYAVNDVDNALFGFTMTSKNEILYNGLRSFRAPPARFGNLLSYTQRTDYPDGYLGGAPLGGMVDFSKNKFACEIQSKCNNNADGIYSMYVYFRCLYEIEA